MLIGRRRFLLQAPLIALYNKYKDSKGKQAKLKSPGQLQELLDVVRALLADMEAKSSSQRWAMRQSKDLGLLQVIRQGHAGGAVPLSQRQGTSLWMTDGWLTGMCSRVLRMQHY